MKHENKVLTEQPAQIQSCGLDDVMLSECCMFVAVDEVESPIARVGSVMSNPTTPC